MSEPKGPKLDIPRELEEELSEGCDPQDEYEDSVAAESSAPRREPSREASASAEAEGDAASPADPAAELEKLRAELEEMKDRHLRAVAEHQNQRRRLMKEQQDAITFANENLIKDLLGTVDNLERALSHAQTGEGDAAVDPQNLLEGVELTLRSLVNVLERSGVEVVDASDTKFDPRHHEAMRQIPAPDLEPGNVAEVYQKGYLLRGRLLRPALVAVVAPGSGESNAAS